MTGPRILLPNEVLSLYLSITVHTTVCTSVICPASGSRPLLNRQQSQAHPEARLQSKLQYTPYRILNSSLIYLSVNHVNKMVHASAVEEFKKDDVELTVPPSEPRPILIIVMVSPLLQSLVIAYILRVPHLGR